MLVASGVEFGDACMAAVGQLPQVIGNIQTAIGCGTIRRAGGIAVQVAAGDPVCQGDVIETAADGRIEIRFVDGTVFNLSRDARVELSEFVRDSNGTSQSALFAVTRGTFAFMAGRLAKTSSLTVDTPVGSIRSRAQGGGIGMLSLAALIFSTMKEVQAADPNVTFLDDDSITYKDLEHGVFELVTKEAVPRHIIVEDPGETIVLSRRGSSVSVNQIANTATRMEELQAAQQDVLANFAKGFGPTGSSPPFSNPQLLLQPINFIQPDTTHGQNSLPPIEAALIKVPDIFFLPPPTVAITGIAGQIGIAADNIINAAQADAGVEITGTTSGVDDGRIVKVTITDSSNDVVYSGTATVTSNTWSINLDPAEAKALADGIYKLTADTSNAAGNPAEASRAIRVDETPPTIAIHTTVGNNVVNINAANSGFVIAGTSTDAENGQPVTVKIVDGSGHVVDTFTTTLTNNTWSVNVSSTEAKLLHDGSYTVTADVSDSAGNPAPEATQAITVDETPPTVTWLPQAESGIEGTAIVLGAITATVNSLPGHSDSVQSLVVSGIPAGAVLTDGTNSFMATSGSTSIDVKSWNLSNLKITPPNDTNFTLTVTATDQDANTASASELVTVAPLAPGLNPVAAHGNEDTAIALDLGVTARSLSGANGDASPNSLDTLVVSDIPAGATLSDGTGLPGHSFTATADSTSHDVASWNLSSLTITPPAEFEGSFTLAIAATERDSEGNISATVTATEVVTVAPVAEPPTARAPATLTLSEDATDVAVAGVSVGPLAEDNDDTVSATLTVSHGTLHVASLSGVTVTGDDCATLTLSGSAAAVNSLLAGLTYTPADEYEGSDTLHLSVTSRDGSNTYPTQATAATAITVIEEDPESLIGSGPGVVSPTNSGTVTSGAIGQIAAASAATTDFANAGGTNTSLVLGNFQNFVGQIVGFTGDGTAGTLSASQTFTLSPTKTDGGYGTFTMTAAGVWTYTLDDTNYAVQALHADDTLTDTFTVHTIDGTAQLVTIPMHGASDDDRYDFDHLATGTLVVADPPHVYGIPQHDSIAAGGNEGQIIHAGAAGDTANGTGKADFLNAGSGNDTIKGNDGADTIYGGSGSNTINANSANGTLLGGHGPDSLTGGNGNDRFAFLSVADSRAARFDSLSDFRSGSDRIDLSALGALGFVILALTPMSTSVPAHTIAWLYDSADNETILYVNPTDQTLRVGASGLLEIHVQGIATIQASDFVPEPTVAAVAIAGEPIDHGLAATAANDATIATMTTALVLSGTTISDDALLAASDWTWQKTEGSFSFGSFDEGRSPATEHTDDAVVILTSGHSIEPQRGSATAPMENNVTFDKAPAHDSAGSMPIGNAAVTPPSGPINNTDITAPKAAAEPSHLENGATPQGGGPQSHSDDNIASETSDAAASNNKVHSKDHSKLEEHSVSKDHSDLKEHSELIVTNTGPVNAAETHMHRSETAGKLMLADSFKFKDELPGHKGSDVIDRGPEGHTPASISHHENSAGPHGLPESSETQTIELSPPGQHSADHFSIVPHHVPHDLIV
jgi:VCBS repeat-containing protein